MIVYCANCEAANREEAETCGQCGHRLKAGPLKPTPPSKRQPVGESLARAAGMAVASASANVAQVTRRAKRTLSRKSRAIIAGCNLAVVVIVIGAYFIWWSPGRNEAPTAPRQAAQSATLDTLDSDYELRFAFLADAQDGVNTAAERRWANTLRGEGVTIDHYNALAIAALNISSEYTGRKRERINFENALKSLYGNSLLERYDLRPYHLWWKLHGMSTYPNWFVALDNDNRCSSDLIGLFLEEWSNYAMTMDVNGAPGLDDAGSRAIRDARKVINKLRAQGEKRDEYQFRHAAVATTTAANYDIEVTISDYFGSDELGETPGCKCVVKFTYTGKGG